MTYIRHGTKALSPRARSIADDIAARYGATVDALRARSRKPVFDRARQHIMAALRAERVSSSQIAILLNRDPSTVCHGAIRHRERPL